MTSAQMLDRVQKLLDTTVSTTSFWNTDNVYQGLSDGQREVVNRVLAAFNQKRKTTFDSSIPKALEKLIVYPTAGTSVTTNYASLPSGFLQEIAVKYDYNGSGNYKHLNKEEIDSEFFDANSYKSNWTYWITNDKIYFGTSESGSGVYQMIYFQKPTEISGSVEPILPDFTHEAIVQYATAELLKRDERIQEATVFFNQFLKLVEAFG